MRPPLAPHRALGGVPPASPRGWRLQVIKCFTAACVCHWGGDTGPRAPGLCWGGGAPQLFLPLPIGTGCLICINLHRSSPGEASRGLPTPLSGAFPRDGGDPGAAAPPATCQPRGGHGEGRKGIYSPGGGQRQSPACARFLPIPPNPFWAPPIPFPVLLHSHIPSEQGLEKKNRKAFGQEPPTLVPSPWAPEPPRHHPLPR